MSDTTSKKLTSTKKLMLLVTIVKKAKLDYFVDLLSDFNANLQLSCIGNGTTKSALFTDEIGSKGIIFSVLTDDNVKKALKALEEKFSTIRDSKGVAFASPIDSVMGVTLFNFLSNNKTKFD